jgi:hypothetical protein
VGFPWINPQVLVGDPDSCSPLSRMRSVVACHVVTSLEYKIERTSWIRRTWVIGPCFSWQVRRFYKSIFWQKFKILQIFKGLCLISTFCMMVFFSSFQQASWNSEVFGHMTRMLGLLCMGRAESATKISNVWHHQVALTPLPQYLLPFAELLRLHAFLGLLLPFQQNNCRSLNIL